MLFAAILKQIVKKAENTHGYSLPFRKLFLSISLFPPILAVMEDDALSTLTLALLEEGNLVSYAKLYVFADVEVSLGRSLQIEIVPNAVFHTETDVVESLIRACLFVIVE